MIAMTETACRPVTIVPARDICPHCGSGGTMFVLEPALDPTTMECLECEHRWPRGEVR